VISNSASSSPISFGSLEMDSCFSLCVSFTIGSPDLLFADSLSVWKRGDTSFDEPESLAFSPCISEPTPSVSVGGSFSNERKEIYSVFVRDD